MKTRLIVLASAAAFALTIFACTRSSTNPVESQKGSLFKDQQTRASYFSEEVGGHISGDSAQAWLKNYALSPAGFYSSYFLEYASLEPLLEKENCTGIIFYNAVSKDKWIVLPYAISGSGQIFKTDSVMSSVGNLSWSQASECIATYQKLNPSGIEAHFFGRNVFSKMKLEHEIRSIKFRFGLNQKGEQLLMTNADLTDSEGAYDISRPCPPFCPDSETPAGDGLRLKR